MTIIIILLINAWSWAKNNSLAITTVVQLMGFALITFQIHQTSQQDLKAEAVIYYDHLTTINGILLQEDEVRKAMNLTEKEIVSYRILNDYQKMYEMRCDRLFKKEEYWDSLERLMFSHLNKKMELYMISGKKISMIIQPIFQNLLTI